MKQLTNMFTNYGSTYKRVEEITKYMPGKRNE